jgi:hypothetical protein
MRLIIRKYSRAFPSNESINNFLSIWIDRSLVVFPTMSAWSGFDAKIHSGSQSAADPYR